MVILVNKNNNGVSTDSMLFRPLVDSDSSIFTVEDKGKFYHIKLWLELFKRRQATIYVTSKPWWMIYFVTLFSKKNYHRIVFHCHDLYPDVFYFAGSFYRIVYYVLKPFADLLLRRCDTIIVPSNRMKDYMEKNYNQLSRVEVVENWTDLSIERIESSGRHVKKDKNKFIYVGNIGVGHVNSKILEYFASHIDSEVIIKTDRRSQARMEKIFGRIDLLPNVSIITERLSVEELNKLLLSADFGIVAVAEGFDNVLFPCKAYSYLAINLPIAVVGNTDNYILEYCTNNGVGCALEDSLEFERNDENFIKYSASMHRTDSTNKVKEIINQYQ